MSETLQVQFGNCLTEFIKKMRDLLPTEKKLFSKYYKHYRRMVGEGHRIDFIAEFIQYLSRYNKEIAISDEGLFSEEINYYPGKPIQLMKGIDFKRLWKLEQMTPGSKLSVWQYLKSLYLMGTHVLKESEKYQRLIKEQKEMMDQLLQSLKYEKQIKRDAQKMAQSDAEKESGGFNLGELGDLFTEDNIVTQIAMEIAKDFNFAGELGDDPIQAINQLFSQDGGKFREILTRVSHRINRIAQEKGLTEEQLVNQAKEMGEKLMKMFKGIPGIDKLTQDLVSNLTSMGFSSTDETSSPSMTPDEAKERLDKCREMIQTVTSNLKENMSQLGLENLEAFQKNIQSTLTQMSEQPK